MGMQIAPLINIVAGHTERVSIVKLGVYVANYIINVHRLKSS